MQLPDVLSAWQRDSFPPSCVVLCRAIRGVVWDMGRVRGSGQEEVEVVARDEVRYHTSHAPLRQE